MIDKCKKLYTIHRNESSFGNTRQQDTIGRNAVANITIQEVQRVIDSALKQECFLRIIWGLPGARGMAELSPRHIAIFEGNTLTHGPEDNGIPFWYLTDIRVLDDRPDLFSDP